MLAGILLIGGWMCPIGHAQVAHVASEQYIRTLPVSGLSYPSGVAVDAQGDVFIADSSNSVLLEETPTPYGGYVQSTVATFGAQQPWAVAVDQNGSVYVTQLAGGTSGGADGVILRYTRSTNATWSGSVIATTGLTAPKGIAVDSKLNIYISDTGNNAIVKLQASTTKPITYTQIALSSLSGLALPQGIGVDKSGDLFIADYGNSRLLQAKPGTTLNSYTVTTIDSTLKQPEGLAMGGVGEVYVSDISLQAVYKETESAGVWTRTGEPAGTLSFPESIAVDASGSNLYVTNSGVPSIVETSQGTGPMNFGAVQVGSSSPMLFVTFKFDTGGAVGAPQFLTAGTSGLDFASVTAKANCAAGTYATGATCNVGVSFKPLYPGVRAGAVVLPSSSGGPAATAYVQGTGLGPRINFQPGVLKSELSDTTRMKDLGGAIGASDGGSLAYSNAIANAVYLGTTSIGSGLKGPTDVALDVAGNIYILDAGNNRILKETPGTSGHVQSVVVSDTLANSSLIGLAVDPAGNVFYIESAKGTSSVTFAIKEAQLQSNGTYTIVTPSLKTSTGTAAALTAPTEMAVDAGDNLYVIENSANTVLKETLTSAGYVQTTLANSEIANPKGVAVDALGNVYISDWSLNQVVEETLSYSAATGKATYTQSPLPIPVALNQLGHPAGMAVSGSGTLYIANANSDSIMGLWYYNAPTMQFPTTQQNTTTSETVTVINNGNLALNFPIPTSGTNPSLSADYTLNGSGTGACTQLTTSSSKAATLAPEASCELVIEFTPPAPGTVIGQLVLTDNTLNAAGPGYSKQTIGLRGNASLNIPVIDWQTPAAITYGTALSATQLNATASYNGTPLTGTFVYTPAAGTVLGTGTQTLNVKFTPTNTSAYTTATGSVQITVNPVPLTVVADSFVRYYGSPNPSFTASYIGFVNGDTAATAVKGAPALTTEATQQFPWGYYTITIGQGTLTSSNYTFSELVDGTLIIQPAPLTVTATNATMKQGSTVPTLAYTFTGFKNGDTAATAVSGAPLETTTATSSSPTGSYPITITQGALSALNYSFVFVNGTLTVTSSSSSKGGRILGRTEP